VDGDGTDELIVGMNGAGGLHAVGADGTLLWKITSIGNVGTQAVIPAQPGRAGMVFATEATGSVQVCDARGKPVRTLRRGEKYCSQVGAAVTDEAGSIPLLLIGDDATMALDPRGVAAWTTTAMADTGGWRGISFASGDVDGNGQRDRAFLEASGDLVIATPQAEKLGAMPRQHNLDAFAIVPTAEGQGILVTLQAGHLRAFRFQ
jgi:outer membrane protein assembly factor BamB